MPARERISIAMCTYNGEKYVREELESFSTQTRPPDELVVCDDCSTDHTVEIVEDFAREVPFEVRVHVNQRNLRYPKNLERAIDLCTGDLIVFADWDDVWVPEKLERVEAAMNSSPDVGLVFSDADVVDQDLHPTGVSLWRARGLGAIDQLLIPRGRNERLLRGHLSPYYGTTMAFRSRYKPAILPIPSDWHAHDTRVGLAPDNWIAIIVASMTRVALVPEPLVKYRQHGGNESGVGQCGLRSRIQAARRNDAGTFVERARRLRLVSERLADVPGASSRFRRHLSMMERHNLGRARIVDAGVARVPLVARELLSRRYRYSSGLRSAAIDLLRGVNIRRLH